MPDDLETTARELASPRHDDLTRDAFAARIRTALETAARETREATLREVLAAKPELPMNEDFNFHKWAALWWLGVTDKEAAIRALIDAPATPGPTVALARLFADLYSLSNKDPHLAWVLPIQIRLIRHGLAEWGPDDAPKPLELTPLGTAALRIAEDGGVSRKPKKPRLTPEQCRYFDEVHRMDIKRGRHPSSLEQAFCDVHDGGLYEHEVEPLIRKKLLVKIPMERCDIRPGNLLGCRWSVFLTDYGMSVFWPRLFRKRQAARVRP